ncbi:hypothetical protein ABEB36_013235 [Hypothenemus hampei]|uniref:FAM13A-like domain-containing protein n=1 Tax=Hypothenemus hampei TaxID=57062 RepID=A0ABD1EA15_HYPHA
MKSTSTQNEDTSQKQLADPKTSKAKKTNQLSSRDPSYSHLDEAKVKLRKRKERQESLSSLNQQDRKVIRSNSEERPLLIKNSEDGIRRVSSSGDFPKSMKEDKPRSPLRRTDIYVKGLRNDDCDYDKMRSYERFTRAHTFKSKKHPRRCKIRGSPKVKLKHEIQEAPLEATTSLKFLEANKESQIKDRSPSPVKTPVSSVDFASLYEQTDSLEPVISQPHTQVNETMETMPGDSVAFNKMLSSPRNSIIATHRIYLDPDVGNISTRKLVKNPIEERIQKLAKQINSCKKKILICEADFEMEHGTKPSQIDKMNDTTIRKLYVELSKLKREQKKLSEISVVGYSRVSLNSNKGTIVTLQETVKEIEEKLHIQREESNVKSAALEAFTSEQLMEEKISTQKALLYLESLHGRPQNKDDRDLVRPLYDRYRLLKQMILKITNINTTGELATIDENEAMHFVASTSSSNETESEKTEMKKCTQDGRESLAKWHSLSKAELMQQLNIINKDKQELKRKIKDYEKSLCLSTGRMMLTKEDKIPKEDLYEAYKKVKSRLKLIEALIGKL